MATCSPLRKASFTAGFWAAVQGAPFMGRVESSRAIDRPAGAPFQVYAPNRTPTTHLTSQTKVRATAVSVARTSSRVSNPTSKASAKRHTPEPTQQDIANQPANRAPIFLSPHPLHLPPSPHLLETSQETALKGLSRSRSRQQGRTETATQHRKLEFALRKSGLSIAGRLIARRSAWNIPPRAGINPRRYVKFARRSGLNV